MSFSERLRFLMSAYKLTAIRIAKYCRLLFMDKAFNSNTVYSWLNEQRLPGSEHLKQLSIMFNISADWLLGTSSTMYSKDIISRFETDFLAKCVWFRHEEILTELPFNIEWNKTSFLSHEAKGQLYFMLANIYLEFKNYVILKCSTAKLTERIVIKLFNIFLKNRRIMREYMSAMRFITASGETYYSLNKSEAVL